MRVAILHNAVAPGAGEDDRDVLDQVAAVGAALDALGHGFTVLPCTLDLGAARDALRSDRPDVVFNLVESLGDTDRLIHLVPSLLDALGLPYTGTSAVGLHVTTSKLLTKERLWAAGLPAAPALASVPERRPAGGGSPLPHWDRAILKSVWEHGSPGLADDSVVPLEDEAALSARLRDQLPRLGGSAFAEPFIEGRELNVSVLVVGGRATALPVAEIVFTGFPAGKPHIVGRAAKWEAGSAEDMGTPRSFARRLPGDDALFARIAELSVRAFEAGPLHGYGRVDWRVDTRGAPFILELNANPCLTPGAGFDAALKEAGLSYADAVGHILGDALRRGRIPHG